MNKLDRMIEQALAEEDRALIEATVPRGFFAEFFGQLSGRNAWVGWLSTAAIFVYVGLGLWCGYKFFTVADPVISLKWGLGALLSVLVIGMLKLYMFGEMQTARILRELKRVELMLAVRDS
ncbi:MAG: hypothetical protein KDK28_18235 [Maritimibacter sp.]|nr:hypothetical protein [Maritimibacter sp.]